MDKLTCCSCVRHEERTTLWRGYAFNADAAHTQASLTVDSSWAAHTLEAWVARASAADTSLVYTGADDSAFKL